jgi:ribosomal protein L40E
MPLRADSPMLLNMTWVPRRASLMQSCQVCKHCYAFQNKGVATCPPAEIQQLRPKRRTKSELTPPILPQRHPRLPTAARPRTTPNRFFADPASGSPPVVELVITSQVLRNQSRSRIEEGGGARTHQSRLADGCSQRTLPPHPTTFVALLPKTTGIPCPMCRRVAIGEAVGMGPPCRREEERRPNCGSGLCRSGPGSGREPGRTNVDFP